MAVIGHIPRNVGLDVLESGMVMVAHVGAGGFFPSHYYPWVLPSQFAALGKRVRSSEVYVATTLVVEEVQTKVWGGNEAGLEEVLHQEGVVYAHPAIINRWLKKVKIQGLYNQPGSKPGDLDRAFVMKKQLTYEFQKSGVKLLLGTDSPPMLLMPGFSIQRELELLKECGLKPYEILKTATRLPGEFISTYVNDAEPFGTIEVGKRADLLLLRENPLNDVTNVRKRVGVMARGRWYSENYLQGKLVDLAKR